MLHRFLDTIQAGEVQSLLEIARTMDIHPGMVLQMANELTKKGYLQEIGSNSEQSQDGCPDCSISSTCQVIVRHWFLTEKGRVVVANTAISK